MVGVGLEHSRFSEVVVLELTQDMNEFEKNGPASFHFPLAVIAPTHHDGLILCSNIACAASSPLAP